MLWQSAAGPLVIGHRGASAEAPENTLAAFVLAREQEADGIELDVQLTADGWPVVIHDERVDRTTNGTGRVADLTLAQIRSLEAGQEQGIPTLDEVFETLGPGFLYNVELKGTGWRDSGLATAVADRIQSHQLEDQVIVSSFNPLLLRRARRHLTRRTRVAHLWYVKAFKYKTLLAPSEANHPYHKLVDADYMTWARRHNWLVNVWTVDEPDEAQRLAALGVDAIITNKPQLIRASLGYS